jgi:hypothetical protein
VQAQEGAQQPSDRLEKRDLDRWFSHRDIGEWGNRESCGQEVLAIQNREVQNPNKEESAMVGPAVSIAENRDSRDRQS